MSTVALVGTGNIGSTVAQLAVDAGHDVVLSNSRGPQTLTDLVDRLGGRARAATTAEAVAAGDLVVLTIPLGRVADVDPAPFAGKVVLDTCNYYPQRDGDVAELDSHELTTSQLVARHLPGARVVKAFNNIYSGHLGSLQRPAGAGDRTTLMVAGDDAGAKEAATAFIESLGYDVLDTGFLADSWRFQRDQPAYAGAYAEDGDFQRPRTGVTAADLQPLLDAGDRSIR